MRTALTNLDKCLDFASTLTVDNATAVLGTFIYSDLFKLTNAVIDKDEPTISTIIESYYNKGCDLAVFVDQYLDFLIDLAKYCMFKDMTLLKIPSSMEQDVIYVTGADQGNNIAYFNHLIEYVLNIKVMIKNDSNVKSVVLAMFMELCNDNRTK
jgi:DNA polymerase III gamma/tau subunit